MRQNIELVRRYVQDRRRLSPEAIPEWIQEFWDPDGSFDPVRRFPEARRCHGWAEIARFMRDFRAAYDHLELEIKDLFQVVPDGVLAHLVLSAEGRTSGVSLRGDLYSCCWVRDGKLIREEHHLTMSGALSSFGVAAAPRPNRI
jgi:hypothetical protein